MTRCPNVPGVMPIILQTPSRLLGNRLRLFHTGSRLYGKIFRVQDIFLRDGPVREQIPLTIEVHLHLRHRRLRLRHAGLRLQIRGSGGIRVRAFQHQQRLTLTYKVTEAHEHPADTSGERKHEVREPVRVSLHLTRRRDDTDRDHGGLDRSRAYVSELGTAETDNILPGLRGRLGRTGLGVSGLFAAATGKRQCGKADCRRASVYCFVHEIAFKSR